MVRTQLMGISTLLNANLKRHRGCLLGIMLLMFILSITLVSLLTLQTSSQNYIHSEMDRLGYGDLTAWVSGNQDPEQLQTQMLRLPEIAAVDSQQIIYANYLIGGHESDSEGQMILYTPDTYAYRFFNTNLTGYTEAPGHINRREIYVPVSLISTFNVSIGDRIDFVVARNGVTASFVIKGFFEDPFMGSTMIGMKSFLISEADLTSISDLAHESGINALARDGAMVHVMQAKQSDLSSAELNALLNGKTSLPLYTEFVHSKETLAGFMLILQRVFSGLFFSFVCVLLVVTLIVLAHTIENTLEQDSVNIGILKSAGFTSRKLQSLQVAQYLFPLIAGGFAGVLFSLILSHFLCRMTLTTLGVLIPSAMPLASVVLLLTALVLFLVIFVMVQTRGIDHISPVRAIQNELQQYTATSRSILKKTALSFWMALRQLSSGRRHYISSCLIAFLLVFFASMIGRMDSWLGPNGEGLMDAFNPADLDLGVQIFSDVSRKEVESVISSFSPITDYYELAMPSVALQGVDYTVNVITGPERLHIIAGKTCRNDNEIVLTEFLAADLGLSIGDSVRLSAESGSAGYTISGLYQCANDMGANFAMSREAYLNIAHDDPRIWCGHYFLQDPDLNSAVMDELEKRYGADVHVHENGWPGLYGILRAMHSLMVFMYVIVVIVIFTSVYLSGTKMIYREQHDLTVYRVTGFTVTDLRFSFALRFGVVAAIGALGGLLVSMLLTDTLLDRLLRMAGISGFTSHPDFWALILPALVVSLLFTLFAFHVAKRIGSMEFNSLVIE